MLLTTTLVCLVGCPETAPPPKGVVADGAVLFATAEGSAGRSCTECHCAMAEGDCYASAPNIQGEDYDDVDRRTRNISVSHTGGKFDFSNQDVADIAAFLESLEG
jgi:cytochrome c553